MPISKKAKKLGPDHIYRHPTLFDKEDLDAILIPEEERLTPSEYKKKKLHEKLAYKHPLPEQARIYENNPLTKQDLTNYAHEQEMSIATNTPNMAITALAQYANKRISEVTQADAVKLHLSTETQFPEGMNNRNLLTKFRDANNIDKYGPSQHQLIKSYGNHLLENSEL